MSASQTSNRVQVLCPCGKKYRCRPDQLGKQFVCRTCGQSFEAVDDDAHRSESLPPLPKHCTECGERLPDNVSYCLNCGYDQETGEATLRIAPPVPTSSTEPADDDAEPRENVYDVMHRNSFLGREMSGESDDDDDEEEDDERVTMPLTSALWIGVGALCIVFMSYLIQADLTGRWFLCYYGTLLAACWTFAELNRAVYRPWTPVAISVATFVMVGLLRYNYGLHHGMHKFTLLFLMMIGGSILMAAGVSAYTEKRARRGEAKLYVVPCCVAFAGTFVALVTTAIGGTGFFLFLIILLSLFGRRRRRGWFGAYGGCGGYGGCSSCGGGGCGGGCGGGGCGGCGG